MLKALIEASEKFFPLRIVPNGYFPTGSPNSKSQNKMNKAIEIAEEKNAEVIIGVDGDSDKIVSGHKHGLFNARFVMIPILKTLLTTEPKSSIAEVFYDPRVSPLALKKWGELNVEPLLFHN